MRSIIDFKRMRSLKASLFSLIFATLFITGCVFGDGGDGGDEKETYSIFGTWETKYEIYNADLPNGRKLDIDSGAILVLNSDNTFSYDYTGTFKWPIGTGGTYGGAPDELSKDGSYTLTDDKAFRFSFVNGDYSYTYTIRYSDLTADSVNLECTMYSEKTDDTTLTATDTFTFKCIRK